MRQRPRARGPYLLEVELLRQQVPSFRDFPFCLPSIRNLHKLPFHPSVTFLVGENGSGKSTLLEALALACDLNPEGGSRNFTFSTRATHTELDRFLQVARSPTLARDSFFLRAESFYNVATEIERLDRECGGQTDPAILEAYGNRSLHEQSHGESFFALFQHRLKGNGLYLMDEPEAALSPNRQLQFLALLHRYCQRGGQFVIATHSPLLLAYPDAWIYVLGQEGIERTPYEETEHFRVTRAFLTHPRKMLDILLADEEPV